MSIHPKKSQKNAKPGQRYSDTARSNMRAKRLTKWISDAKKVHGTRFDYSEVHKKFQRQKTPRVEIKCIEHDDFFSCSPFNHLRNESGGCPQCTSRDRGKSRITKKSDEFKRFLKEEHPGHLELVSEYVGIKEKVTVRCQKHSSRKTIIADNIKHLGNWGCDQCSLEAIQAATQTSPEELTSRLLAKTPEGVEVKKVYRDKEQGLVALINCIHHGEKVIGAIYAQRSDYLCPECGKQNVGWTSRLIKLAEESDLTVKATLAVMELKVFDISAMKVGFTQRKLTERYGHFLQKVFWASEMPALHAAQIELEIKYKFATEKDERIKKAGMRSGKRWGGDEEFYFFKNKQKIIHHIKRAINSYSQNEPNYDRLIQDLSRPFNDYVPREKDLSNQPIEILGVNPDTKEIVYRFPSIAAAQKALGARNISTVLNADLSSNTGRRRVRGLYWVKESEYDIDKLPTSHQRNIYNARKIRCVETDKVFPTIRAAEAWAKENGLSPSKIGEAARGKRKTAAGLHWVFVD